MAEGLNKVLLIGNLGADPELSYTQTSQAILKLRLATNESFTNKAGERQDRVEWHRVVIWGKRAEALSKFLSKGRQLYVEGRLQTRSWEDKDGQKRYSTDIVATEIILLGGGAGARDRTGPPPSGVRERGSFEGAPAAPPEMEAEPSFGNDDDIPF